MDQYNLEQLAGDKLFGKLANKPLYREYTVNGHTHKVIIINEVVINLRIFCILTIDISANVYSEAHHEDMMKELSRLYKSMGLVNRPIIKASQQDKNSIFSQSYALGQSSKYFELCQAITWLSDYRDSDGTRNLKPILAEISADMESMLVSRFNN